MKAFRLVLAENGEFVSSLHFLDRSDANRYQKIFFWPWETLGYFRSQSGQKMPLSRAKLRIEVQSMPGIHDADLDWVLWKQDSILGYVPLLPGRCFDPSAWRCISSHDLVDPMTAPKIAHAGRQLESSADQAD